ncbi:Axonemal Dynein Light Intermediate Polypeptide 1 [Manis pentadactyla]|nr:Axonemal Dynein Light Intermediate Polypeptide 1 [Manis pentadactyla]
MKVNDSFSISCAPAVYGGEARGVPCSLGALRSVGTSPRQPGASGSFHGPPPTTPEGSGGLSSGPTASLHRREQTRRTLGE